MTDLLAHEDAANTEARHAHRDLLAEKDAEIERLTALINVAAGRLMWASGAADDLETCRKLHDWAIEARIKEPRNDRTSGSTKWGADFPPSCCTAWEDCVFCGECHDENCGAQSQNANEEEEQ